MVYNRFKKMGKTCFNLLIIVADIATVIKIKLGHLKIGAEF